MTPDEVRRLDPNKVILIPERQNPILVDRIVYWQDPRFKALIDAQKGPLPYPDPLRGELDALRAEVAALRDIRVIYPAARPPNQATEPERSAVPLVRAIVAEPEGSAGVVAVDDAAAIAAKAKMNAFDQRLQETNAAAAEIDPS